MRKARLLSLAAAIVAVAALVWLDKTNDDWSTSFSLTGKKTDYYNLLVHGLQKGHLYLDVTPDPALWSPDPFVQRRASFLLDASLFNHRYYIYFGVVPAVVLLLPYSCITGSDLSQNVATLVFVLVGFLFSLRVYRRAERDHFPGIGPVLDALNVLLLAFATLAPVLVKCSGMYELAISSGYAFCAAAFYFLYRALRPGANAPGWVAAASLSLGLAVGCRPDYILSIPVLAAAAWWASSGAGGPRPRGRRAMVGVLAAAVLPCALVGVLLGAYNYARFGSPLDFGFRYGLNSFKGSGHPLASASFIWPNLRWYYLTPPVFTPYFPYFFPINASPLPPGYHSYEAIHGECVVGLLIVAAAIGSLLAARRGAPSARALRPFMLLLGWAAAAGLAFMACLGIRADRYMADFQAPLVLLVTLLAGTASSAPAPGPSLSLLWRPAYAAAAMVAILFNVLIGLEVFGNFENLHPRAFRRLARLGDLPIYELGEHGLVDYGPLSFSVVFPAGESDREAPLLATGAPNRTDVLYAHQYPQGRVELEMAHEGYVALKSGILSLPPGTPHAFEVDMGSLYPPRVSAFFDGWDSKDVDRLRTTARVLVDGKEVIRGRIPFYDSSPGMVNFGGNPQEGGARFEGRVTDIQRLPLRDTQGVGALAEPGTWRADVVVPWLAPDSPHPLLGSGVARAGNLLSVYVSAKDKIRFNFDQWNSGFDQSPALDAIPGVHRVEIFVGPQVARQKWPKAWRLDAAAIERTSTSLNVWWDGALVWTTPVGSFRDSYDLVSLGSNPQGFSTADMIFPTGIEFKPYSRDEMREFIRKNLRR